MTDDKDLVMDALDQAMNDFFFYNRKIDKELPLRAIERAIARGDVTVEELVTRFKSHLQTSVKLQEERDANSQR